MEAYFVAPSMGSKACIDILEGKLVGKGDPALEEDLLRFGHFSVSSRY